MVKTKPTAHTHNDSMDANLDRMENVPNEI